MSHSRAPPWFTIQQGGQLTCTRLDSLSPKQTSRPFQESSFCASCLQARASEAFLLLPFPCGLLRARTGSVLAILPGSSKWQDTGPKPTLGSGCLQFALIGSWPFLRRCHGYLCHSDLSMWLCSKRFVANTSRHAPVVSYALACEDRREPSRPAQQPHALCSAGWLFHVTVCVIRSFTESLASSAHPLTWPLSNLALSWLTLTEKAARTKSYMSLGRYVRDNKVHFARTWGNLAKRGTRK